MKPRLIISILSLAGLATGQVYTPPPANQPAQQQQQPPPQDTAAAPAKQPAASPLGQEIPMLDPSAETITVGGVAIPLGDNRILKARFEKYLSQPPESDEAAARYRETIAEILATISPFRKEGPDLYSAFKLLPSASSYPGDANLCGSLAESIYTAMLAKQDVNGLNKLNLTMESEKKAIIAEGDWKARHERDKDLGNAQATGAGKGGKGGGKTQQNGAQSPGSGTNSRTERTSASPFR